MCFHTTYTYTPKLWKLLLFLSQLEQLENLTPLIGGEDLIFPELQVSVAVDGWQERKGYILASHSINLGQNEEVGKTAMYGVCVFATGWNRINGRFFLGIHAGRWLEVFL